MATHAIGTQHHTTAMPAAAAAVPITPDIEPSRIAQQVQKKLAVGSVDDPLEHEADAVADKVMRMPETVQRKCVHCDEEETVQRKQLTGFIQRKEAGHTASVNNAVSDKINATRGGGESMDRPVRSFMESRFGSDFSDVKIHTGTEAVQLSRDLNAQAFTVGNDIYFNQGRYNPSSSAGGHLLAHELTHTLQQSAQPLSVQREPDEKEKDPFKRCMAQPDTVIPGQVGLLGHMHRDAMMEEMFGAELKPLQDRIQADPEAKKFTCEYGISGIVALVETEVEGRFNVQAAREAAGTDRKEREKEPDKRKGATQGRFGKARMSGWNIGDWRLGKVKEDAGSIGDWAAKEDRGNDTIPTPSAALNMPAARQTDIGSMISELEGLKNNFGTAGPVSGTALTLLEGINTALKDASGMRKGASYGSDVRKITDKVIEDADILARHIDTIGAGRKSMKVAAQQLIELRTQTEAIGKEALKQLRASLADEAPDYSELKDMLKQVRVGPVSGLREQLRTAKTQMEKLDVSIPKLIFVLKYFKAINDKKSAAPDEVEMNKFRAQLEDVETELFFGPGPVNNGLFLMRDVIDFVRRQIAVRLTMSAANGNMPALVPALNEVEAYFTTLNGRTVPNNAVRQAYTDFASAYFQHRIKVSLADLHISGITDVFALPTSITGTRSIVCGGYAQMGAALAARAGGTKITFTLAVRASQEQIQADELDDAHAIARVTRQSGTFFISNHLTTDTEAEAMDVNWAHPTNPLHIATGNSYNEALTTLQANIARLKR